MATLEIMRKRKRIRMRFRGIIRVVICRNLANVELENELFTDNLKKNIITFLRRQAPFSMLTKEERIIFGKPYWTRTNEERKKLVDLILSLECFKCYPPKACARVTPYLYFMRVEPGRILIKEGHTPKSLYFILNGECVYSKIILDPMTNQMVNKNLYLSGPGDIIGQSALIKKSPRPRTVTVLKNMEVLTVDAEEFYKYLYPSAKFQYDQKLASINKFEVLNNYNVEQKSYSIQYGLLKEFQPMDTIYCQENTGMKYTYFILNGQCMILHSLKIRVKELKSGRKIYELCDDQTVEEEEEPDTSGELMKSEKLDKKAPVRKTEDDITIEDNDSVKPPTSKSEFISFCPVEQAEVQRRVTQAVTIDVSDESLEEEIESESTKTESELSKKAQPKWQYETHFIDVGTLSFGSIFGLGERMSRRSIMARTVVQCYILPRFWLLDKMQNPGNIWQQMRFHLDATIPSEQHLYQEYLNTLKWIKLKSDYITSLLEPKNLTCKIQDIPAYCRIIESGIIERNDV